MSDATITREDLQMLAETGIIGFGVWIALSLIHI